MPKNTSSFGDIQITPLSGQFDVRSPSGTLPIYDFRLVLNASMNEFGKRCRRPGWRKYGAGSPHGFNNQDLHDRLDGLSYYCDGTNTNCPCPPVPDCLRMVDYEYGVVLENCVDGADSDAPEWDGTLSRTGDCEWGFSYGTYAFGGKDAAIILRLVSCSEGVNVFELEIVVRLENGTGLIVWQGTSQATPVGTYERTDGCDETATVVLENCSACTAPVITASPPGGSEVMEGTYIALFATEGATIFFTTDGTTPDNTDELYTGPFQIFATTTVKAIAYTGTCVSDVETFVYTVVPAEDFLFEFTCDDEDQAGVFHVFNPNGSPDYNWRLSFSWAGTDIVRLEIYETDSTGKWNTGQAWATDNPVFPVEMGGDDFAIYPLVLFESGNKLNTQYEGTVLPAYPVGDYVWMMYGQPFVPLVGYFKLIFTYNDADLNQRSIVALIPNECGYYY